MNEVYQQILWICSIPVYAVFIPLEIILSNFHEVKRYSFRETVLNVYMNLLNTGFDLLMRGVALWVLLLFYNHHFIQSFHPVVYWFALFLGEDFLFWLEHYVDHSCRLFWAVHVTHHSSTEYNLSTGFRSSVFMPFYRYLYFIPLALIGFRPGDILFMYAITQLYGILVHTQAIKKVPGFIGLFMVTPSHHRVHHASNVPYLDRNMGMVLIIWDRIFGTFTEEIPGEKPTFGLTKNLEKPFHPVHIITHEWEAIFRDMRRKISLKDKLKYLFRQPGWSHDGATKTAKQLRKEWIMDNG